MSEKLRKAAKGLLAFYDSAPGKWGAPHKHKIEALRAALQPTDAGGEETLEQRLKDAAARVAAMSPEEREAMFQRQKEGYVRAEMSWGDEGTRMAPTPPATDPLATAINRYAGPGRELFEMMLAEIRRR